MTLTAPARRGVEAQTAEHALVEVLLDDLERAAGVLGEDVDGARLGRASRRAPASAAAASSTSTAMKMPSFLMPGAPLGDLGPDDLGDVLDPLGDGDAGLRQARDLLGGRVLLAFDDRAGVAEAHARHLCLMKRPAMKATIGRRELCSVTQRASSASMRPPGSV